MKGPSPGLLPGRAPLPYMSCGCSRGGEHKNYRQWPRVRERADQPQRVGSPQDTDSEGFEGGPGMHISRAPALSLEFPVPFPPLGEPAGGREGVEEQPGGRASRAWSMPIASPNHWSELGGGSMELDKTLEL